MKNQIRKGLGIAAFVMIISITQMIAQDGNYGGGRLAGAWDAAVTITNCETGAPIRTFLSLGSFNKGGTFTGITAGTPPAGRTPEVGVWRHEKADTYTLRFKAFLFDPTGNPIAYQVVTHEVILNEDNLNYTSGGGVKIYNMAGIQIATGCSTAVATRMTLD